MILEGFRLYFREGFCGSCEDAELDRVFRENHPGFTVLYVGDMNEKGKPHGRGILREGRDMMTKGCFKNGKFHGIFKYYVYNKFKGSGYAINGVRFYHIFLPFNSD